MYIPNNLGFLVRGNEQTDGSREASIGSRARPIVEVKNRLA